VKQLGFNNSIIVASVLFLFGTIAILFFTPRTEIFQLCAVYFSLYVAFIALYHEVNKIRTAAVIGVFARCIAWLSFPTLSDDIYRFIWDGEMTLNGFNPFLLTPSEFIVANSFPPFEQLYPLLNSPDYHSVYPEAIQITSAFGALASNDFYLSSLHIKLPILLAEIGTIWMLPKVLMRLNVSPKYSIIYMLNPLLIIDVVANAHFEAVMIFFIVLCIKFIQKSKLGLAGSALALAVGTKLIPILLFPFLWKAIPKKFRVRFSLSFAAVLLLLFIPLYNSEILLNYWSSIRLYYQTFEFNASLYYVAREISEMVMGYNGIAFIGPSFGLISIGTMAYLLFQQQELDLMDALKSIYWGLFAYFILATTVHPWYIAVLLILGILTRNFSALAWSLLVILSYSAYSSQPYSESMILIFIEYAALLFILMYPKIMRRLLSSTIR